MKRMIALSFALMTLAFSNMNAKAYLVEAQNATHVLFEQALFQNIDSSGHMLVDEELLAAVGMALADSNFAGFRDTLIANGYDMMLENSFGVKRDFNGDFFVSIGFNKGNPDRTDQLIYLAKSDGSVGYTRYLTGEINSDGELVNAEEYEITNGGTTKTKKEGQNSGSGGGAGWKEFLACVGAGCTASAIGCIGSNCGYLVCLGLWCAGSAVGCGVAAIISNL